MKLIHPPFFAGPGLRDLSHLLLRGLVLVLVLTSCTRPGLPPIPSEQAVEISVPLPVGESDAGTASDLPHSEVTFRASVPAQTPEGAVYLTLVDEVTGLALNAKPHAMELLEDSGEYSLNLAFPVGSVVKYRYERQAGGVTVGEHLSNGEPVRYRLYVVDGPGVTEDVVSRWTDTPYSGPTGRIMGQLADASTGLPLPNLLVTAGGEQTLSAADGSFLLEGLPEGIHNLVAYSLDGSYRRFQQGARVAAGSTTPAPIQLSPTPQVEVTFIASLPEGTPPVIPVRLAGNLRQLGCTFANLAGGANLTTARMPVLQAMEDGRYSVTLKLPAGADLRYKYTLGDGFWNAEHAQNGAFIVRQLIVPDEGAVVEEEVASWQTSQKTPISFDLTTPGATPPGETISIQFNPVFGWNEPVPMWQLGPDRWAYILYGPLNLPGSLGYRFCRNNVCGGPEQSVDLQGEATSFSTQLPAWDSLPDAQAVQLEMPTNLPARDPGFVAGVALQPAYHPAWSAYFPATLEQVQELQANWLALPATWTFTRQDQLAFEPLPGKDPLWLDLSEEISQAQELGLDVALYPQARFASSSVDFWAQAPRDFAWWLVWFERYRTFALHHARLAAEAGTSALILGGNWVQPALPEGQMADGTHSGVPADAEVRWRSMIEEVRELYSGELLWALPSTGLSQPPSFLDIVDGIYLTWSDHLPGQTGEEDPRTAAARILEEQVRPLQILYDQPVIVAASLMGSDPATQAEAYNNLLELVNEREWISGFVSEGFTYPAPDRLSPGSVNGQPAAGLLHDWYSAFLGQ